MIDIFSGVKDNSSSSPERHGRSGKIIPGIVVQILRKTVASFQRRPNGDTKDGRALDVVVKLG